MQQLEFFKIKNPCIGVCESGPKGFCLGCYRSREERQFWLQLESDVKYQIIKACASRKNRADAAKKRAASGQTPVINNQSDLFD